MCRWLRERQDRFEKRKGSWIRGVRLKTSGRGGVQREKSGTLSWRPHVMRFSLFTSLDTKSPPSVFIFSFLIRLFSSSIIHFFCRPSQIPNLPFTLSLFFNLLLFSFLFCNLYIDPLPSVFYFPLLFSFKVFRWATVNKRRFQDQISPGWLSIIMGMPF